MLGCCPSSAYLLFYLGAAVAAATVAPQRNQSNSTRSLLLLLLLLFLLLLVPKQSQYEVRCLTVSVKQNVGAASPDAIAWTGLLGVVPMIDWKRSHLIPRYVHE